jgi:hypothetical protein
VLRTTGPASDALKTELSTKSEDVLRTTGPASDALKKGVLNSCHIIHLNALLSWLASEQAGSTVVESEHFTTRNYLALYILLS